VRDRETARGRRLQYATITWNGIEVFVTIGLGIAAQSLALVAFGLDSVVEIFASLVVVWYLGGGRERARARRSLRLVAVAFAVLAVYLVVVSTFNLIAGNEPEGSPLGIAYLTLTAAVMFTLAHLKRSTARRGDLAPLAAEAEMTFLDGCLAVGIMLALVANAVAALWWADAVAALVVAGLCVRESVENWQTARPDG